MGGEELFGWDHGRERQAARALRAGADRPGGPGGGRVDETVNGMLLREPAPPSASATPEPAEAGTPQALDSELARTNDALRLAETRLRQVMDLVPNFIYAQDLGGRFVLANKAVSRAYGLAIEGILGKTDAELGIYKREVVPPRQIDPSLTESGPLKLVSEEQVLDSTGRLRQLQTVQIPFTLAQAEAPSMLCVSTDITELRRSEERLRALVEGTSSSVGEAFFCSLVRHLSGALGMRLALVGELVGGSRVRTLAVWSDGAQVANFEYDLEGTPCADVMRQRELCFYPCDVADLFPLDTMLADLGIRSYLGTPLIGAEGEPLGLLAVLDSKDQDETSEAYRHLFRIFASRAAAELARQQVDEQRRELQAQMLHVQKLESLGILAGGIAHDFNNLLASILGNAGMAQLHLPAGTAAAPFLDEIEQAAQRSAELVQQMLAYAGKGRFSVEKVDLNELVREMTGLLRSSVSKRAELALALEPAALWIEADATQIRQVVMNLITNASDALGDGNGRIELRTAVVLAPPPTVAQALGAPHGHLRHPVVLLRVEDTGCGMDEATRAHLFDPFFTTKEKGRGLGLSALLGIVRAHRGAVWVDSAPGAGTTISIYLPAVAVSAAASEGGASMAPAAGQEKASEPAKPGGRGRVLVVDDEPAIRQLAARILARLGYEVLTAVDGVDAIEVFRATPGIRAVLLDLAMPRMSGAEALVELRRLDPRVKVVLSSGFGEEEAASLSTLEGVFFLHKPYRPQELDERLRMLLEA
jgi:two-component system cell cycle sensor histidine kinase/response regulator CckA